MTIKSTPEIIGPQLELLASSFLVSLEQFQATSQWNEVGKNNLHLVQERFKQMFNANKQRENMVQLSHDARQATELYDQLHKALSEKMGITHYRAGTIIHQVYCTLKFSKAGSKLDSREYGEIKSFFEFLRDEMMSASAP